MRKKVLKFVCVFTVIIVTLFCSTFSVSALTPVYFKHAQPQVTTNSCYLEISYDNTHYFLYVFGYSTMTPEPKNCYFRCWEVNDTTLAIDYSYTEDYAMKGYWVSSDGQVWDVSSSYSEPLTFTIGPKSTRNNIRFYGMVEVPFTSSDYGASDYVFVYGEDSVLNEKIDLINTLLAESNSLTSAQNEKMDTLIELVLSTRDTAYRIDQKLLGIWNDTDSIDNKLDRIISILEEQMGGEQLQEDKGKLDESVGGMDDATGNAMGGKSDQDVQNEVGGAIGTDNLNGIDFGKAGKISSFFDRCLNSFGSGYQSLLLLSLVLGLSAFLIGRRYG